MNTTTYAQYIVLIAPWERDDLILIDWIYQHTAFGVIVVSFDGNTINWPCSHLIPAHNLSFEDLVTALSSFSIAAVVSLNMEVFFPVAQAVALQMGCKVLPEPSVWQALQDKPGQHQVMAQIKSAMPKSRTVRSIEDATPPESGYPYIMKPTNLYGQIGIKKVNNPAEFTAGIQHIKTLQAESHDPALLQYITEPFITGTEYEAMAFIADGKIAHWYMWERRKAPDSVIQIAQIIHPDMPDGMSVLLTEIVQTTAIQNGILSVQAIHTPSGWDLIEIMPRPLGGYALDMITLSYGANPLGFLGALLSGQKPPEWTDQASAPVLYMGFISTLSCPHFANTTISRISIDAELDTISHNYFLSLFPGLTILPQTSSSERYGFILVSGETLEEAEAKFQKAVACISFTRTGSSATQDKLEKILDERNERKKTANKDERFAASKFSIAGHVDVNAGHD